jgi:hypothetical protein
MILLQSQTQNMIKHTTKKKSVYEIMKYISHLTDNIDDTLSETNIYICTPY